MSEDLKNIIESVLLVADAPLSVAKIQGLFQKDAQPEADVVKAAIESLQNDCETRGIELTKVGSGYRFQTKAKYADWVRKLLAVRPPKLSRALLETLAIIAYRQPVTRGDIEEIRGVAVSADIMQRLQEREWIKQIGVRDVPGRPGLFGTTPEFLAYFNLSTLKDLPALMEERDLGEIAKDMETPLPPEVLAALDLLPATEENDSGQQELQTSGDGHDGDSDEQTDTETTLEEEGRDQLEAGDESANEPEIEAEVVEESGNTSVDNLDEAEEMHADDINTEENVAELRQIDKAGSDLIEAG